MLRHTGSTTTDKQPLATLTVRYGKCAREEDEIAQRLVRWFFVPGMNLATRLGIEKQRAVHRHKHGGVSEEDEVVLAMVWHWLDGWCAQPLGTADGYLCTHNLYIFLNKYMDR